MGTYFTKVWRDFFVRLAVATGGAMLFISLFAFIERTQYYFAPLIVVGFGFLAGIDIVIELRLLKRRLIPMREWTKKWDLPIVASSALATLIIGVMVEELFFRALILSLLVGAVLSLGMLRRRSTINRLIGHSDTPHT